jgi:cephalosporin-C deacetylase
MIRMLLHRKSACVRILVGTTLALATAVEAQMVISPDKTNGVYDVGDTVHWTVEWKGGTNIPIASYVLKSGGQTEVAHGELAFTNQIATFDSKLDGPNTILADVHWGGASHVYGGAVAAPGKILPAAPPPEDFLAFWQARLKDLEQVPANPQLEAVDVSKPGVQYWKISLDNIWNTHVQGQIARPEKGDKFPALLIPQWAGVYGLQKSWVTDRAADGWLALNIEAHDIPIDKPESFYTALYAGALKNYWNIGNDERDKSYYVRMYLSCVQAMKYLKSRPDWNGKTLVVMGQSQGGQQTLMLAGLCPDDVTAALALVPAASDMLAPDVGRATGFPGWYFNTAGKDPKRVRETSRYFDPVNFARYIKCPVLIGLGLHDEKLAPPSSILAAANVITSTREVIMLAHSGHQDEHGSQTPYNNRCYGAWLPALAKGEPPPANQSP